MLNHGLVVHYVATLHMVRNNVFSPMTLTCASTLQPLVSPAGVERLFSRAGRYHDDKKKRTTDEHIETLLTVAKNML